MNGNGRRCNPFLKLQITHCVIALLGIIIIIGGGVWGLSDKVNTQPTRLEGMINTLDSSITSNQINIKDIKESLKDFVPDRQFITYQTAIEQRLTRIEQQQQISQNKLDQILTILQKKEKE